MNISTKLLKAAAGQAGGAGLDVDDCFSCFLWAGNSTNSRNIVNGIDVSGEGGLVWIKDRTVGDSNSLFTTDRGANKTLLTDQTDAEDTVGTSVFESFNSNGFTVGSHGRTNENNRDYVSWTFRKAPKFFDIVTYTGNFTAGTTISHNLGQTPGMIIFKDTSNTRNWYVYHRSLGKSTFLSLDQTIASFSNTFMLNNTDPTSTEFTLGEATNTNANGATYVAYLFAHNNNDGEFGPDQDADIIKCGTYTGGTTGTEVNVGFEPQFVMIKRTTGSGDWMVFDAMRGVVSDPYPNLDNTLFWNLSNAERTNTGYIGFTPTGFIHQGGSGDTNTTSDNYIYMAIRRGPLAVPTDATKVFGIDKYEDGSGDGPTNGIVNDFSLLKAVSGSGSWFATARLRQGHRLKTDSNAASASNSNAVYDRMDGVWNTNLNNYILWGWKRAPSYFDVCAWTGNDTAGRTVAHNLGVVPEMIWVKNLSAAVEWVVYHKDVSNGFLKLNTNDAKTSAYVFGANSSNDAQSATNIILSSGNAVNELNKNYIGFLFATVAGVSKVGSYTGNDTGQNIDCGFSSGARFVLIKCSSHGDRSWMVFDSTRGIVAGADPFLTLNSSSAEYYAFNGAGSEQNYTSSNLDLIDPYSSGFAVVGGTGMVNENGKSYIFYAIA